MNVFKYIIIALISAALSFFSFVGLLSSCAGHPPPGLTSTIGVLIIPLALLLFLMFGVVSLFFGRKAFKAGKNRYVNQKQPRINPFYIFLSIISSLASFVIFLSCIQILSFYIVFTPSLAVSFDVIAGIISILAGIYTYKKLSKKCLTSQFT